MDASSSKQAFIQSLFSSLSGAQALLDADGVLIAQTPAFRKQTANPVPIPLGAPLFPMAGGAKKRFLQFASGKTAETALPVSDLGLDRGRLRLTRIAGSPADPRFVVSVESEHDSGKKPEQAATSSTIPESWFNRNESRLLLGIIAGGIAHDFNNHFGSILGMSELISVRLPSDSPLQVYVEKISNAVERGRILTRQIAYFAGKINPSFQPVRLHEAVTEVLTMLRPYLAADGLAIDRRLPENTPATLADPRTLLLLITALFVESREAIRGVEPADLNIEITSVDTPGPKERFLTDSPPSGIQPLLRLSVRNNGPVSAETVEAGCRAQVFADNSSGLQAGSFLKAAVDRARSQKFWLSVESREPQTGFSLQLYCRTGAESSR